MFQLLLCPGRFLESMLPMLGACRLAGPQAAARPTGLLWRDMDGWAAVTEREREEGREKEL